MVEDGLRPLRARDVEDPESRPVAQDEVGHGDTRVGAIRPRLTEVLVAEEVVLRALGFDDPQPLAEHGRREVDLIAARADHPYRRSEPQLALAQDPWRVPSPYPSRRSSGSIQS